MTNSTPYNDIGPFEGVPENWRRLAATRANGAYERACDIARRSATLANDSGAGQTVVRQSAASADAAWRETGGPGAGPHYLLDLAFELSRLVLLPSVPGSFAIVLGMAASGGDAKAYLPALVLAGIAILLFAGIYYDSVSSRLRNYRDFKARGYAYDDLPDAVMGAAGNIWVLGEKTIVLACADDKGYNRRRVVFYDAVGTATIEDRRGLQGVTLVGRDGSHLGRIDMPEGPGIDGPEALVAAIKAKTSQNKQAP
ncbi:hypothetical protein O9X98_14065 [Agrobacterium salinitolerans]|nr:hypothetical protein [Agrobacterium salinitolerans]